MHRVGYRRGLRSADNRRFAAGNPPSAGDNHRSASGNQTENRSLVEDNQRDNPGAKWLTAPGSLTTNLQLGFSVWTETTAESPRPRQPAERGVITGSKECLNMNASLLGLCVSSWEMTATMISKEANRAGLQGDVHFYSGRSLLQRCNPVKRCYAAFLRAFSEISKVWQGHTPSHDSTCLGDRTT